MYNVDNSGQIQNLNVKKEERVQYLDYLRVISAFSVIVVHVASVGDWHQIDVSSIDWAILNIFSGIARWAVPVFVMISGTLFLGKEIPISKIYSKYVLRLIIAFVFWGVIYGFASWGGIRSILISAVAGHYHMWFILMIIGLYISIPIIKKITENEDIMRYFLLLSLLFAFIIPMLTNLMDDFGSTFIEKVGNVIEAKISDMNFSFVMGYTSYFILGYFLNRLDLKKKYRGIIYALGVLGAITSITLTFCISIKKQETLTTYYGNFSFCVLLESTAIFTLFKYHDFSKSRLNKVVNRLAPYSFGAYMVHILILDVVRSLGLKSTTFTPLVSVPLMSIIIFSVSNVIAAILKRIPVLRKYVV